MNREKNDASLHNEDRKSDAKRQRAAGGVTGERGKQWLFWTMDICLVAAIVAAILIAVSLLTPFSIFKSDQKEERTVLYTVEFVGVDSASIAQLKLGDTVTDTATGSVIGTVTSINNRPYTVYTDTCREDNGLHVVDTYTYPETYVTVTVTISVSAEYVQGSGYTAQDCRIAVGAQYALTFPNYAASGTCIAIRE